MHHAWPDLVASGAASAATPEDRFLQIAGAGKTFGQQVVLHGVDLAVARGEFVSLLGPSGCGKTTLLRIVAGLLTPDRGSVRLDGQDITHRPPHKRDVGVVFQNYALFPHLSVAENVAFGLQARRLPKGEIAATVARFLELVHLSDFADRSVKALSGGQQQRVAVARALAVKPKLLLLDEPFSALDRKLRENMQIELKRLLRELAITAVFVTHDQDEALNLSDRIAVMNRGAIEQLGAPATIYRSPATPFALEFIGLSTRLNGTVTEVRDNSVAVRTPLGKILAPGHFAPGTPVLVGVRPERIVVGSGGPNVISAPLRDIVFQGSKVQLHFAAPDDALLLAELPETAPNVIPGRVFDLSWRVEDTLIFAVDCA